MFFFGGNDVHIDVPKSRHPPNRAAAGASPHPRQAPQRILDGRVRVVVITQIARKVAVVRDHLEVAVMGQDRP